MKELKQFCDSITVPLLRTETEIERWKYDTHFSIMLSPQVSGNRLTNVFEYSLIIRTTEAVTTKLWVDLFSDNFKWFVSDTELEYEFGNCEKFEHDFVKFVTKGVNNGL